MNHLTGLLLATFFSALFAPSAAAQEKLDAQKPATKRTSAQTNITWKRTVVDKVFRSEGVGVADFNKDGKMDIFVGDAWYEAPDWKMHDVRGAKPWDPIKYSESFCCFPEDFTGDGYPDVIVIPFPGKECYWYQNPGAKGGQWKAHLLTTSACNETPIYVDLFGQGKKVLVMAWQPKGKDNEGQMCYFTPQKDPTQPWVKHSISGPSQKGKEIPATRRFSHGLGHGDVNGDGRADVITPSGWWEQPGKVDNTPWKFHAVNLEPICADMHTYDLDGDKKADIISSSAHQYGFWWHQQKPGKDSSAFLRHDLFLPPPAVAKLPTDYKFSKEEVGLLNAINKVRNDQGKASWKVNTKWSALLRTITDARGKIDWDVKKLPIKAEIKLVSVSDGVVLEKLLKEQLAKKLNDPKLNSPALEIGVALNHHAKDGDFCLIVVADTGRFSLPAQTHALHCVDMNGDGLKDLVTGRRWWAHGPKGDAGPNDPAYLYWFEAQRDNNGVTTFIPRLVDDDSGIGTQFAIADMNGDGLLDIIISNKKGVFLFIQGRQEN